jgi:hypothetical protein
VLGRDLDPLTRQVEDDAAVDDEPGHVTVDATSLRSAAAAPTARPAARGIACPLTRFRGRTVRADLARLSGPFHRIEADFSFVQGNRPDGEAGRAG